MSQLLTAVAGWLTAINKYGLTDGSVILLSNKTVFKRHDCTSRDPPGLLTYAQLSVKPELCEPTTSFAPQDHLWSTASHTSRWKPAHFNSQQLNCHGGDDPHKTQGAPRTTPRTALVDIHGGNLLSRWKNSQTHQQHRAASVV